MKDTLIERYRELAKPIVRDVVQALEQLRRWESDDWYPKAHAYSEEALVPHTETLFDDAEEAEVLALWFARAFLTKLELMPEETRWEDAQDARMLLVQASMALGDFLRRETELPVPVTV